MKNLLDDPPPAAARGTLGGGGPTSQIFHHSPRALAMISCATFVGTSA